MAICHSAAITSKTGRLAADSSRGLLRAGVQLLLNKTGEILKPLKGRGGKLTWTGVDQAQRAKATAIAVKNRKPGIKADSRFAGDQRVVGKPIVQKRVRHDQGRTTQDDVTAEGDFARGLGRGQTMARLEPLALRVDE